MDRSRQITVSSPLFTVRLVGILFITIVFFAGISSPCYGGIYRYIDENGDYHFTNCPRDPKYQFYIREKEDSVAVRVDPDQYNTMIKEFSEKYGVDSDLVRAVIHAESGFDSYAVSRKGAKGLMQLMPQTAEQWKVIDVFNPRQNIEGGVRHLKYLLETFENNLSLSLAAYNAGKNAVIKYRSIPPYDETRNYVRKVLRFYESYKH